MVVADRTDDARDGGAVRLIVLRTGQVVQKVVALVGEQIRLQIRMVQVNAGIEHGDDDIASARPQVPGLLHADAAQIPLKHAIQRVVRHDLGDLLAFSFSRTHQVGMFAQSAEVRVRLIAR